MTSIINSKVTENKYGELYKVLIMNKQKIESISITLKNVKTLFGLEKRYNNSYIKWTIDKNDISVIRLLENMILDSFKFIDNLGLKSSIIQKKDYPTMIETKLNNSCSNDIIKHKKGEIITFNELKSLYCNIDISLRHVNIQNRTGNKTIYYNLEIKEIALLEDK
tara:strand:+ start:7379 stop:7873 length:495 start_codon:yes stop_codon:yes gene_type:complete